MKKLLSVIVAALYLIIAVPAYAAINDEVKTFGFTDERHRYTNVNGTILYPMYFDNAGASYSQSLILDGSRWNMDGETVVIAVENNELKGYVVPESNGIKPEIVKAITPAWSKRLDGSTPTKSHPTFVEDKDSGKKYIYIGTYSSCLDIVDITDFNNVNLMSVRSDLSTDITSAPLVLKWKGHDVVVATSGNTGNVFIITDPLDSEKMNNIYIKVGQGRTSSSPAPVAGGQGFAVGLDGGQNYGELQVYYLDNILTEDGQGKVIQKSGTASIKKSLKSGLVASFCTDGSTIYFGDCQSRVYGYNVSTGSGWINGDSYGTFSNRSPALSPSTIYFPAVGAAGEQGKVVSIDRASGKTNWVVPMAGWDLDQNQIDLGRAQTAPVILSFPDSPVILEGTSTGQLAIIDPIEENMLKNFSISKVTGDNSYATGVAGEISIAGDIAVTTSESGVFIWQLVKPFNLEALDMESGVPEEEEAVPGKKYTGMVVFGNQSYQDTPGPVSVFAYSGDEKLILKDADGQAVTEITLKVGEEKTLYFDYIAKEGVTELGAYVNMLEKQPGESFDDLKKRTKIYWNDSDYQETTVEDNIAEIEAVTIVEVPNGGNGQLTFQAVSQGGKDLYGKYLPPTSRQINTAKWEDMVTATLKPPAPTPPKGTLKSWSITSAKITIPKQHPKWTFNTPYEPVSSETLNMTGSGHTATATFKETWSIDGFNSNSRSPGVYSIIEKRIMAATPKPYTITAEYTIHYTYEWQEKHRHCSGSGKNRHCHTYYVTKTGSGSTSGTASKELTVDGAGRVPY